MKISLIQINIDVLLPTGKEISLRRGPSSVHPLRHPAQTGISDASLRPRAFPFEYSLNQEYLL
jgi:hypothetical protein